MKRIYLCILLILLLLPALYAQSSRERYDFQYLLELFEKQEDRLANNELKRFTNLYPQSSFKHYLGFIEAGLTFRRGELLQSLEQYEILLQQNLDPELRPEVMLGAIISAYLTKQPAVAEQHIQRLITEIQDPVIASTAYYYRGMIQFEREQFYSAELSFKSALYYRPEMKESKLLLFRNLLILDKPDEARELLSSIPIDQHNEGYAFHWLKYLLGKALYGDFEVYLAIYQKTHTTIPDDILPIVVRYNIILEKYSLALSLSDEIPSQNQDILFYRAVALSNTGEIATADSIFAYLSNEADPEIAVLSYLERLKLLFARDRKSAVSQLQAFIAMEDNNILHAQQYYLLGLFFYNEEDNLNAMKYLKRALLADLDTEFHDQVYYLIAHLWYQEERFDNAVSDFNRYLNLFPAGKLRDRAWFYLGQISFSRKNYSESSVYFNRLLAQHPDSELTSEARFFLAEIDFNQANYTQALSQYMRLLGVSKDDSRLYYRIAQSHFYIGNYENTHVYLNLVNDSEYEIAILRASTYFNQKKFNEALTHYQRAEQLADLPTRVTEAKSYQALVYYQLKKFNEASKLFLQISSEIGSPDTYLYLSAKSSFLARDYHRAIQLYDSFIDTYPESKHFLSVLNELANVYYNIGNYNQAVITWLNTIQRFSSKFPLTEEDFTFLTDVFAGLELGLRQAENEDLIEELVAMIDSIRSEFMRFELQFILLHIYADRSLWAELYSQAQEIRSLYPQKQRQEVEFLMVDALINLNEYSLADSVFSSMSETNRSPKILNRWAQLDLMNNDPQGALQKFMTSYSLSADTNVWSELVRLSSQYRLGDFEELWRLGADIADKPISALHHRLNHLFDQQRYFEADSLANYIIESSADPFYHASAFLCIARINYIQSFYNDAIRNLRQIRILFPEYKDIVASSYYYNILSLFELAMFDEGRHMYEAEASRFSDAQKSEIERILNSALLQETPEPSYE